MKKMINKIKSYKPPKHICFLYFFVPIFLSFVIKLNKEEDIWFLLNHGKYVLTQGFPYVEPFSIHQNLSFVMQQWLTSVIFYLTYDILGKFGLLALVVGVNLLILFFLYKLCMLLSDNKYFLSTIITCITDIFLTIFILPRPQIFTILALIIVLYIMELFHKNKDSKAIYFLPLVSLVHINLHASMWFMLYLFMLPYIVDFSIRFIKEKRDKRIFKVLFIVIVMFLCGFINPYGIDNILYVFNSYGNRYINTLVVEMLPPMISSTLGETFSFYGKLTFFLIGIVCAIYIFYRKNKPQLRHMLLLAGVIVLAISNIRNLFLYIIGSIPFLAFYLKDSIGDNNKVQRMNKRNKIHYGFIVCILLLYLVFVGVFTQPKFTNETLEKGIDSLLENNSKENIVLYTNYNNGSYCQYRGIKTYIDTRAEVYLKTNNKKADIFEEYFLLSFGYLDYEKFLNKYQFTHLLVQKNDRLYSYLLNNENYKTIYKHDEYRIFERVE